MSFRCGNCNKVAGEIEKPKRRVTQIREKAYLGGGQGWEIVKELNLGDCCKNNIKSAAPAPRVEAGQISVLDPRG